MIQHFCPSAHINHKPVQKVICLTMPSLKLCRKPQHDNTDPVYLVSLRYMAFNDGQDVMEGQSGHLSIPQAHNITQHQSIRSLPLLQTMDFEGLQLTPTKASLGWMPRAHRGSCY